MGWAGGDAGWWFLDHQGRPYHAGRARPQSVRPRSVVFAIGLLGLRARLAGNGGWPERAGGILAYVAVALSAVNAPYSIFFAEDGPQTPFPFNVTYLAASLAIFVGLIVLGGAVLRTGILPPGWRALPLALGVSALLPVWALALIDLELPVVLLGLGWVLLGYALWAGRAAPAARVQH